MRIDNQKAGDNVFKNKIFPLPINFISLHGQFFHSIQSSNIQSHTMEDKAYHQHFSTLLHFHRSQKITPASLH